MPTAVVFGASGQDGRFLRAALAREGCKVLGFAGPGVADGLDISDASRVRSVIQDVQPTYLFHLAAKSTTNHSAFLANQAAIVGGTANVLEAVEQISPATKVFVASSGLVFRNSGAPINERAPIDPQNAYSVARVQSLTICRYFRSRGLSVYVGFLFSHESQYRPEHALVWQIARGVTAIQRGKRDHLLLGNPDTVKEWTWAGDVADAMVAMVRQDTVFEAVIGSGRGYSAREFAEICFRRFEIDPVNRIRKKHGFEADYRALISDPALIRSTGWRPKVGIEELGRTMVEAAGDV